MKRWLIPSFFVLLLVGCAPAIVQTVNSTIGQERAAQPVAAPQPDAGAEPLPDAPAAPVSVEPQLPAFELREPVPDTAEERAHPIPAAPRRDLEAVAQSSNAFALDILGYLRAGDPNANIIYSPYSIYTAFAMLYAGAAGDTAAQLAEVMRFDLDPAALHPALGALEAALTVPGEEGFTLNIANALWGQVGVEFAPPFLETLERTYGAALRELDFRDPGAADAVNQWVSNATNGKIPRIVGSLSPATVLVLANAIYFNAEWATPFDAGMTRHAPFAPLNGATRDVDMMRVTDRFAYAEGANYQIVALPYAGGTARMIVLLPANGQFSAFEESLTADELSAMLAALDGSERQVDLSLPKFEYKTTTSLGAVLAQMGLTLPFSPGADLSAMTGHGGLMVDEAIHKAKITVDEEGTEAAAATAIVIVETALVVEADPVTMTVDHPFLYLIQDTQTGAFLFVGRVVTLES